MKFTELRILAFMFILMSICLFAGCATRYRTSMPEKFTEEELAMQDKISGKVKAIKSAYVKIELGMTKNEVMALGFIPGNKSMDIEYNDKSVKINYSFENYDGMQTIESIYGKGAMKINYKDIDMVNSEFQNKEVWVFHFGGGESIKRPWNPSIDAELNFNYSITIKIVYDVNEFGIIDVVDKSFGGGDLSNFEETESPGKNLIVPVTKVVKGAAIAF